MRAGEPGCDEPPSVEDLIAEGFTGDELVAELLRRGVTSDEHDARFRIGVTLYGGDCIRPPAAHR